MSARWASWLLAQDPKPVILEVREKGTCSHLRWNLDAILHTWIETSDHGVSDKRIHAQLADKHKMQIQCVFKLKD